MSILALNGWAAELEQAYCDELERQDVAARLTQMSLRNTRGGSPKLIRKGRFPAYSVEKLGSSGNSINFGELDRSNPLFLLSHISAETPENRRKGVFNRIGQKQTFVNLIFQC